MGDLRCLDAATGKPLWAKNFPKDFGAPVQTWGFAVHPLLDPFAYAAEAIGTHDPDGAALFPDREVYYADPNKGRIVFTGDLTLRVGAHTFHLIHTPGHTPGQLAVHVPRLSIRQLRSCARLPTDSSSSAHRVERILNTVPEDRRIHS